MNTAALSAAIRSQYEGRVDKQQISASFLEQICNYIKGCKLCNRLGLALLPGVEDDFVKILINGTLPSFTFHLKSAELRMDATTIARPQIDGIRQESVITVLQDLLNERISD